MQPKARLYLVAREGPRGVGQADHRFMDRRRQGDCGGAQSRAGDLGEIGLDGLDRAGKVGDGENAHLLRRAALVEQGEARAGATDVGDQQRGGAVAAEREGKGEGSPWSGVGEMCG
jgi:hypothetical protein